DECGASDQRRRGQVRDCVRHARRLERARGRPHQCFGVGERGRDQYHSAERSREEERKDGVPLGRHPPRRGHSANRQQRLIEFAVRIAGSLDGRSLGPCRWSAPQIEIETSRRTLETELLEMQTVKLETTPREQSGKGIARRLRASGQIPAVFYGKGIETLALS